MNVAGAQFDRALDQVVERAHHRRAAGKVAQAVDVVVAMGALAGLGLGGIAAVETLENGGDVLERGDHQFYRFAEHDLGGADRRRIHGIGHRQFDGAAGGPEREHHGFPQEAPGKALDLGLGRQQFEQAYALQLEEPGHLIGEFGGRQVGGFPQFPQGLDGGRAGLAGAGRAAGGQGIFLQKVSAKFLR